MWGYEEPILELKNRFGIGQSGPISGNKFGMLITVCIVEFQFISIRIFVRMEPL